MNGDGAYGNEMSPVAMFENALRAAVPTQPDPGVGTLLVPRLAATARAATLEAETQTRPAGRRRSRLGLVAKVAVAVALIPLALAGLAFAGVHLPQPARDAFDTVGIELPNQPSDGSQKASGEGKGGNDVSDAAKSGPSDERGNSAAAHKHAREQRAKARGKAIGHTRGKAIGLNGATPPGQTKEPPGQTKEPQSPAGGGNPDGPPASSNSGGASESHAAEGGGPSNPLPPQASGSPGGRPD